MKCRKCGNEVAEGALFCTYCGMKIEEQEPKAEEPKAEEPKAEEVQAEVPAQQVTPVVQEVPVQQTPPVQQRGKTNFLVVVILAIIALVLVIVVVVAGSKILRSGKGGSEKAIAYVRDSEVFYTDNMDKDKDPISVCEVRSKNSYAWNNLTLTADGKYLYFFSRIDSDGSGTLCRAEVGKLKNDSFKNDKYIQEISSNVYDYEFLDKQTKVLFKKENGKLILWDGKDEEDVAKDVDGFRICDDESTIFYTQSEGDTTTLAYYDLVSKKGDEIVRDIYTLDSWSNKDFILYSTRTSDETIDLYFTDLSGESEKIAENIYSVVGSNAEAKTVSYVAETTTTEPVYDYIDDSNAAAEAGLTEPDVKNYATSATEQDAMSESELEYYTEYPEEIADFYEYLNYDEDMGMYYTKKYTEDDLGNYINEYYVYDELATQWYKVDIEKYQADRETYDEAAERNELREELKKAEYERVGYGLYAWTKGSKPECIDDNIDAYQYQADSDNQIVVFNKIDKPTTKINIDNVYSVNDAIYRIREYYMEASEKASFYYISGEEKKIDSDQQVASMRVSEDGKSVVLGMSDSTSEDSDSYQYSYVAYTIDGGELKDAKDVADNVSGGTWVGNTFYYFSDVIDAVGDLCAYKNGKSEKILKNISPSEVRLYEDGNYAAYKDYNYSEGGSLTVFDKSGEYKKVSNDVTDYTYISADRIVYMKDVDLYVYTGKDENRRISRNVENYKCKAASYESIY